MPAPGGNPPLAPIIGKGRVMGYRLLVALIAVVLITGCSALDTDNAPYEDMPPGTTIPAPGGSADLYNGYYAGDMSVETNTCQSVSDEVGSVVELGIEIVQADATINALFDSGPQVAGTLDGDKVTIMTEELGVKHVYYLTFEDGELNGSAEAIEADANGQYGDPCATYTIALTKGEKPAAEGEDEATDETKPKVNAAKFK